MLRRADAVCRWFAHGLAAIGLIALIGFAGATLVDGLSRSLLDRPIEAVGDVGPFLLAACVSACFPLAQLQRANITIELAGLAIGARAAQVLRAFAALLVAAVMLAMARQMWRYAGDDAAGGDTTVMLAVPTAPFWYVVATMFCASALAQSVLAATECARCLRGHARGPGGHR